MVVVVVVVGVVVVVVVVVLDEVVVLNDVVVVVVILVDVDVKAVTYESVRGQSLNAGAVRLFYTNVSIGSTEPSLMYRLSCND